MTVRTGILFLLNGERREVSPASPTQTVLQYLRENLRLTGTKEGCNEGDCGACMLTQVHLDVNGQPVFSPMNACLQFLPAIDGTALWTVEGLAGANGALHPVQQALIDHHGSQCGFCTPGVVMSLHALYCGGRHTPERPEVLDQLSGNLCRCTGYRPIIDAAMALDDYPDASADMAALRESLLALRADCEPMLELDCEGQRYQAPRTLAQLDALTGEYPEAVLLGGGTDVGLWVTQQLRRLPHIIALNDVDALRRITQDDDSLLIGAAVSLETAWAAICVHHPSLTELWKRFASLPIRSAGTLVGNLANGSPIGDAAPALIALGAQVILRRAGRERSLPLEDLYVDYGRQARTEGEYLSAVRVPLATGGVALAAYKLSKRFDQDISAVCAGFALWRHAGVVQQVRLAFGGMATTTRRAGGAEAALQGRPWDEATVQQAMQALATDFTPLTDMRAGSAYRLKAAQNLLYRFWLETTGETCTRVTEEYRGERRGDHHATR